MFKEVAGDILLSGAHAIVHGIAPNDNFHQGLALALREQYPAMYKDFRHYCQVEHPKPGTLWLWGGVRGSRIVGLLTQDAAPAHGANPGKATTHNVNLALRDLRKLVDEESFESIAMPRLATGVGGLSWDDVQPLIERHLGDLQIPVYLYTTFQPGVKAKE